MIVPITGNVTYPITLDPTAWVFDDRRILLENAFAEANTNSANDEEAKKAAERWERAVFQQSREEGNKVSEKSYVIPIKDFLDHAKCREGAAKAIFVTPDEEISIALDDFRKGLFLFSIEGKPLRKDGPVHFFYQDGSNRDNPIKHIQKIVIQ